MKAKIEHYKIFKAVADNGNISSTAKELYLSQSAISQSVKTLENSLGVKLFSRTPRGVQLTNDGHTLYEYVSGALSLLETGEVRLNESRELVRGELTIGASNTLTECYLLKYLKQYHRIYPGVKVRILNGTSKRVMSFLNNGTVDIAFATTNERDKRFESYMCFKTHTAFVAAADYPIDFSKTYSLKEISALPLILLEKEAGSRRFLEDCFLKKGLRLEPEIELASYELLISLAGIGLGIAGITEEFSGDALDKGIVKRLNLSTSLPERAVSMLSPKSGEVSMAARKFMDLIRSTD
ncbi:MAG: LysR family transcriptional regulator [Lachnospiraceae bacterium]|nr:LysR family transcriptional regulator [Lachnospiraceae bacterium]